MFLEEHGTAANHLSCSVGTVGFPIPASQCAVGDQKTHSIFGKASEPIGNQGAASFGNSMMLMENQPVTDLVQRMNSLACSPDFDPWVLPILFQSHLAS